MKTRQSRATTQQTIFPLLLLLVLAIQGCGNVNGSMAVGACRLLGICDDPLPAPIDFDLACDATLGSSCDPETLRSVLDQLLLFASDRRGSHIKLWWLGSEVAMTHAVADVLVPETQRSRGKGRNTPGRGWAESARAYFLKAAEANFTQKPGIRSPIAESIAKIALSLGPSSAGRHRVIVLITDARQFSSLVDFECGTLPTNAKFRQILDREGLLEKGTLTGTTILFAFTTAGPLGGRPCPVEISRETKIRELWKNALESAGASRVEFSSDVPQVD
jgi:hypothetical protein